MFTAKRFVAIQSTRLFDIKEEAINLILPFVFMGGMAYEILKQQPLTGDLYRLMLFVGQIVFINAFHVAFTLMMFSHIPEFRSWFKEENKKKKLTLKWSMGFFFVLIANYVVLSKGDYSGKIFILYTFALSVLGNFHFIRQNYGLSSAYNEIYNAQKNREGKKTQNEKRVFFILFAVVVAQVVVTVAQLQNLMPHAITNKVNVALLTVYFVILIVLLAQIFRHKMMIKGIYLLRLVFYPFVPFSTLAGIAIISCHGVEYLFVYRKIQSRSRRTETPVSDFAKARWLSPKMISYLILWAVVIMSLLNKDFGFFFLMGQSSPIHESAYIWMYSLWWALHTFHIYLDGVIFRFGNPVVKKHLGHLLT